MNFAISSGHGRHVGGASGLINEVTESRRVVDQVGIALRGFGDKVMVFHDDDSKNQATNLTAITAWHNKQTRDRDVSVHFNAFSPTVAPRGTEVLYKADAQKAMAATVSKAIAKASGLVDRGAKHRTNLSFLNKCHKAPILIEVCFVDSETDVELYKMNFVEICRAIAGALAGRQSTPGSPSQPPPVTMPTLRRGSKGPDVLELQKLLGGLALDGDFGPTTEGRVKTFQSQKGLHADGIVGPLTWKALGR